jgi:hypothetical protein
MLKFIKQLKIADWIQILILFAIAWYSWETHLLKKWQKKQVQLTILGLEMQRKKNLKEGHAFDTGGLFPNIIRKIYELGKFDPKELYSPAHHYPLTFLKKIFEKIAKIFRKNNRK